MRGTDIAELLRQRGASQAALGRHVGLSTHAMSRLVRNTKELPPSQAALIESFFGSANEQEPQFDRVPVYGYAAAGGDDRVAIAEDRVLDYMEVPKGLVRGPGDVIGIRVSGDSMEPRLFAGETVLVGLNVRPQRFGDCVVELRDNTAMVKQYRGHRDGTYFFHQFNPEKEIRVPIEQVRNVHAVLLRR